MRIIESIKKKVQKIVGKVLREKEMKEIKKSIELKRFRDADADDHDIFEATNWFKIYEAEEILAHSNIRGDTVQIVAAKNNLKKVITCNMLPLSKDPIHLENVYQKQQIYFNATIAKIDKLKRKTKLKSIPFDGNKPWKKQFTPMLTEIYDEKQKQKEELLKPAIDPDCEVYIDLQTIRFC